MGLLDGGEISIPCTNCGKKTQKSLAWVKANKKFICPQCGIVTNLDSDQFSAEIDKAEEAVKKFVRDLPKGFDINL